MAQYQLKPVKSNDGLRQGAGAFLASPPAQTAPLPSRTTPTTSSSSIVLKVTRFGSCEVWPHFFHREQSYVIKLGSEASNDVVLRDCEEASPYHGTLECTRACGVLVYTDHSQSGTTLDDGTILYMDSAILQDGDCLHVGPVSIMVEVWTRAQPQGSVPAALPLANGRDSPHAGIHLPPHPTSGAVGAITAAGQPIRRHRLLAPTASPSSISSASNTPTSIHSPVAQEEHFSFIEPYTSNKRSQPSPPLGGKHSIRNDLDGGQGIGYRFPSPPTSGPLQHAIVPPGTANAVPSVKGKCAGEGVGPILPPSLGSFSSGPSRTFSPLPGPAHHQHGPGSHLPNTRSLRSIAPGSQSETHALPARRHTTAIPPSPPGDFSTLEGGGQAGVRAFRAIASAPTMMPGKSGLRNAAGSSTQNSADNQSEAVFRSREAADGSDLQPNRSLGDPHILCLPRHGSHEQPPKSHLRNDEIDKLSPETPEFHSSSASNREQVMDRVGMLQTNASTNMRGRETENEKHMTNTIEVQSPQPKSLPRAIPGVRPTLSRVSKLMEEHNQPILQYSKSPNPPVSRKHQPPIHQQPVVKRALGTRRDKLRKGDLPSPPKSPIPWKTIVDQNYTLKLKQQRAQDVEDNLQEEHERWLETQALVSVGFKTLTYGNKTSGETLAEDENETDTQVQRAISCQSQEVLGIREDDGLDPRTEKQSPASYDLTNTIFESRAKEQEYQMCSEHPLLGSGPRLSLLRRTTSWGEESGRAKQCSPAPRSGANGRSLSVSLESFPGSLSSISSEDMRSGNQRPSTLQDLRKTGVTISMESEDETLTATEPEQEVRARRQQAINVLVDELHDDEFDTIMISSPTAGAGTDSV